MARGARSDPTFFRWPTTSSPIVPSLEHVWLHSYGSCPGRCCFRRNPSLSDGLSLTNRPLSPNSDPHAHLAVTTQVARPSRLDPIERGRAQSRSTSTVDDRRCRPPEQSKPDIGRPCRRCPTLEKSKNRPNLAPQTPPAKHACRIPISRRAVALDSNPPFPPR